MILLAGSLTFFSNALATRSLSSEVLEEDRDRSVIKKVRSGLVKFGKSNGPTRDFKDTLFLFFLQRIYTQGEIFAVSLQQNLPFA